MNLSRRSLLVAAPAVILTPGLLMPVKQWTPPGFKVWPGWGEGAIMHCTTGGQWEWRGSTWWHYPEVRNLKNLLSEN